MSEPKKQPFLLKLFCVGCVFMGFSCAGAWVPSLTESSTLTHILGFFLLPFSFFVSLAMWMFGTGTLGVLGMVRKRTIDVNKANESKNEQRASWVLLIITPIIASVLAIIPALFSSNFIVTLLIYGGMGTAMGGCLFALAQLRLLLLDDVFGDE